MRTNKQATYRVYWVKREQEQEQLFSDKIEMHCFCVDVLAKNKIHYGINKIKGNKIITLKQIES